MQSMNDVSAACTCGSGQSWKNCCYPLIFQGKSAVTAEALMRSRYVAYTRRAADYLYKTWASQTRPNKRELQQLPQTNWQGLRIVACQQGQETDQYGQVEFIATWQDELGNLHQMHEVSEFVREKGRWVYVQGQVNSHEDSAV